MPFDPPFSGYIQPPGIPPDPTGDCWRGPAGPQGPPGPVGTGDASNTPVTATGSTTPRMLQDRAADWVNVKDFGAVHDGVTDNLAAFNATRAAALLNGTIQVPRGQLKFPNGISAGIATPVLWRTDGTTFPGGTAPIVTIGMPGDVTEGFFNGNKYFGKRSALKGPGATLRVDMLQTDTTGGNITDICGGISVVTQQNLGNTNSVWGLAVVGDDYADASSGGMVGIQSTVRKHAGGDCWAIQTVTLDDTGLASSANGHGFVGAEIAVRTHGLDDASNAESYGGVGIRNAIHLTLNRSNILPGNTNPDDLTSFAHGIWVSGDSAATKTYVGSVYSVGMSMDTYSVFDSRGAGAPFGYTDPVAGLRMLHEQIVDFNGGPSLNSNAGNYLQYTTSGTPRLRYMDGAAELWAVSDTGVWSGSAIGWTPGSLPPVVSQGGIAAFHPPAELIFQRNSFAAGDGQDFHFRRATSFTGGTQSQINRTLMVDTGIGANDGTKNWGFLTKIATDSTTGSANTLAAYMQTWRNPGSNAQCWGAVVEMSDLSGSTSAVGGATTAIEVDLTTSAADDASNPGKWGGVGQRHFFHLVQTRQQGSVANQATHCFWLGTGNNSYIDSILGADLGPTAAGAQTRQIIDARGFISPTGSTDPVASVRMSAGQIIDFNGGPALNSAPGNYLRYETATSKLFYYVGGVAKWSVDASGNMRCAGTVTGSVTP